MGVIVILVFGMGIVPHVEMGIICTMDVVKVVLVGVPSVHQVVIVQLALVQNGYTTANIVAQLNVQLVISTNATAVKTDSYYKTESVSLAHQLVPLAKMVPV